MTDTPYRIHRAVAPVREQVADAIRRALMARHFQPGDHLSERILCEMTGASRTAVREALRALEGEGLIETIPHRGPFVTRLDPDRVAGIYDLRIPLEGLLARRAAERAGAATDAALVDCRLHLATALQEATPLGIVAAKARFYDILDEAAGNPDLSAVIRRHVSLLSLLWPAMIADTGGTETTLAEIGAIIDAILARDPDAADRAARDHISEAARQMLAWLAVQPAPQP